MIKSLKKLSGMKNMKEAMEQARLIENLIKNLKDCPVGETMTVHLENGDHIFQKIGKVDKI